MELPTFQLVNKTISHSRDQWPLVIERTDDGKTDEVAYLKKGEDTLAQVIVNLLNMVTSQR